MQTTTWTTPGGKSVEMTWTVETTEIVNADGHKFEAEIPESKREPKIISIAIGDYNFDWVMRRSYNGQRALYLGQVNHKDAYVGLPDEINELVWGTYDRRKKAAIEAADKVVQEYQTHVAAVNRMMDEY